MPASYLDMVMAGVTDFRIDDLRISRHALQRARERHIPLEDLRRAHGNEVGRGIQVGKTIVTAIRNDMADVAPKTARKVNIRKRIERIGVCPSLMGRFPEEYTFFRNLFQNHPEPEKKRVREIVDISLRRFAKRRGSAWHDFQFVLHFPEGETQSVSWVKCL